MSESTPAPVEGKTCTGECSKLKPLSEFYPHKRGRYGRTSRCRVCTREDNKKSYRRTSDRNGRARAPEPVPVVDGRKRCTGACGEVKLLDEFYRRDTGRYRRECKACRLAAEQARRQDPQSRPAWLARRKSHYETNREAIRETVNSWRRERDAADPEAARARRRANYLAHREKQYVSAARWRAANIERHRANARNWAARHRVANPDHLRELGRRAMARRRARLRGLPTEPYTMEELLLRDGADCVLCGGPLDLTVSYPDPNAPTVEHLECLSWPGSAGDIPSNCGVAHFRCNCSRGDRPHLAAARKRAELVAAEATAS